MNAGMQRNDYYDVTSLDFVVNKRWFGLVVRTEGPMYVKLNKQGGVRRSSLIQNSADTQRETATDRVGWKLTKVNTCQEGRFNSTRI